MTHYRVVIVIICFSPKGNGQLKDIIPIVKLGFRIFDFGTGDYHWNCDIQNYIYDEIALL